MTADTEERLIAAYVELARNWRRRPEILVGQRMLLALQLVTTNVRDPDYEEDTKHCAHLIRAMRAADPKRGMPTEQKRDKVLEMAALAHSDLRSRGLLTAQRLDDILDRFDARVLGEDTECES